MTVSIENGNDLSAITEFLNQPGATYSVSADHNEALEAALKEAGAGRITPRYNC